MPVYAIIDKNKYIDSLESLFKTAQMSSQKGIKNAYIGMGNSGGKEMVSKLFLACAETESATESDLIIVADAESEESFLAAVKALGEQKESKSYRKSYPNLQLAASQNPSANLCVISVPGKYVKQEAMRALNAGLHILIFSSHVHLSDEREIKEYARNKGLLCMGPDCGVANINGAALALGSITQRGPFGICGASGIGIQYIGAMLHKAGSGVSQVIGTGGNDTKDEVGGITMLMGIDALENDPSTKYIILVSRNVGINTLALLKKRISQCSKPVVVYFMGTTPDEITEAGGIWAANLEDAADKAIKLACLNYEFEYEKKLDEIATKVASKMSPDQKYVRGAFLGGTYCDEALRTLNKLIGGVYSNVSRTDKWLLKDPGKSIKNTVIDYGEEEFTQGRPHPTIEPGVRNSAILKEASDPETAVILLDFVLTPPGPKDPAKAAIAEVKKAQELVRARGGELAVVASVCGTNSDIQNAEKQEDALREAGVFVCSSNFKAALLAGKIIQYRNGGVANE